MEEQFEEFQKQYPNLFKEYPRSGFYIGKGWAPLLHILCKILEPHIEEMPPEIKSDFFFAQIKEKFGGLRAYMNCSDPYIDGAITLAESMSFHICEECGSPGELRLTSYHRTLCLKHFKAEFGRKKKDYLKYITNQKAKKQ